ncbi:hypothetical protein K2X33_04640 [bacterium]|nr:hypothetical protein [bacterium]
MWNTQELETFFGHLETLGLSQPEIYWEQTQSASLALRGKIEELRLSRHQGIALRCFRGPQALQFFSSDLQGLRDSVDGKTPPRLALAEAPGHTSPLLEATQPIFAALRAAFSLQNEKIGGQRAEGILTERHYWVARPGQPASEGREQSGTLRTHWWVQEQARVAHRWQCHRANLEGLVEELRGAEGLANAIRKSTVSSVLWPAPEGPLPVLWSARAIAALQTLFLRAFEGDRLLGDRSFLTLLPLPLSLAFTLEDRAATGCSDHEGHLKKNTPLLRAGRPAALACNRRVAEQLEVAPTGHARRESYETPATLGFWNPHVEGQVQSACLLAEMERGLSVREIEVQAFDTATGQARIRLTECYLVHHGAEGEKVEPIELSLPLVSLLETLSRFEKNKRTTGVAIDKQNQSLVTEISAPAALSERFPLPGSVPASHYW